MAGRRREVLNAIVHHQVIRGFRSTPSLSSRRFRIARSITSRRLSRKAWCASEWMSAGLGVCAPVHDPLMDEGIMEGCDRMLIDSSDLNDNESTSARTLFVAHTYADKSARIGHVSVVRIAKFAVGVAVSAVIPAWLFSLGFPKPPEMSFYVVLLAVQLVITLAVWLYVVNERVYNERLEMTASGLQVTYVYSKNLFSVQERRTDLIPWSEAVSVVSYEDEMGGGNPFSVMIKLRKLKPLFNLDFSMSTKTGCEDWVRNANFFLGRSSFVPAVDTPRSVPV